MPSWRHKRGTRAQIDAAAGANGLKAGEVYLVTDEARLTVATAADAHQACAKQGEGGGSDPWTYATLASDFSTSSGSAVDVTGLAFTPAANTTYEFKAMLRLRTASPTVAARPGVAWPSGFVDGIAEVRAPNSATGFALACGNPNAALLASATGLPNTTQSWPGFAAGEIEMGASPSGSVRIQLASETAGTSVTVKAGSWIAWREV